MTNTMRISSSAAVSNQIRRAVYDGQDRIGSIEQCGHEYIARDRRGHVIGRYDTAIEAANAIGGAAP